MARTGQGPLWQLWCSVLGATIFHSCSMKPTRNPAARCRGQAPGGEQACKCDFSFSVQTSREPGWLEGTLNGKRGLIPQNYVKLL